MTSTTTAAQAQEIDRQIAERSGQLAKAEALQASRMDTLHDAVDDRKRSASRGRRTVRVWTMDPEDVLAKAEALGDEWILSYSRPASALVEAYHQAADAVQALRAEVLALEDQYDGWSRFFLVTSSDGHIHSSMRCSTCTPSTTFGWLPDMSGRTEADVVAEHGALLCSVCFPSAPVDWTNGRELEAAKRATSNCAGSGQYAELMPAAMARRVSRYSECHVCHQTGISVTSTLKLRAHKAPREA